jgi:hypothetical protein
LFGQADTLHPGQSVKVTVKTDDGRNIPLWSFVGEKGGKDMNLNW